VSAYLAYFGREEITPIAIVFKSSRLADQPIDDVSVINPVLASTSQARQFFALRSAYQISTVSG